MRVPVRVFFAEDKKLPIDRGFGQNTGHSLARSREILDITGITISETGEPCKGARFEMMVPKTPLTAPEKRASYLSF